MQGCVHETWRKTDMEGNLQMKNRKLKFGAGILTLIAGESCTITLECTIAGDKREALLISIYLSVSSQFQDS